MQIETKNIKVLVFGASIIRDYTVVAGFGDAITSQVANFVPEFTMMFLWNRNPIWFGILKTGT